MIQLASDSSNAAALVFFLFDLLYLDGEDLTARAADPAANLRQGRPTDWASSSFLSHHEAA
jgi:hypothetical protein